MKWLYLIFLPLFLFGTDLPEPPKAEPITTEEIAPEAESSNANFSPDMYSKQFYRTLIFIVIVITAALILIWLIRRFSKDQAFKINHKKNIKILERRQISPSTYLYHLQIGAKQVIISESKCDVRLITSLDWEESEPLP